MRTSHSDNFPNVVTPVYERAKKEIGNWPCHSNRASSLGHDCERFLVYQRTCWELAALHDVNLQLVFREGNRQEAAVLQDLAQAGIPIFDQQGALEWRQYQITGHVDGVIIQEGGKAIPIEIKSMAPHGWQAIAKDGPGVYEWDEVAHAFQKKPWLRQYFAQIQVYMLCKNADQAVLIAKNKSSGALAQININLDYEYAESLVQRAERINKHVNQDTLPERIPWDSEVCGRCKFRDTCCPDHEGDPILFEDDLTIQKYLKIITKNDDAHREYNAAWKRVRDWIRVKSGATGQKKVAVGAWYIELIPRGRGETMKVMLLEEHNRDNGNE